MNQYDKGFLDGQAAAQPISRTSGWISTRERYPDLELEAFRETYGFSEPFEVNVMVAGAAIPTTLEYDGKTFRDEMDLYPVTDWQPLPEPPERSEDDTE